MTDPPIQLLLEEKKEALHDEQWRMRQLENNKARLHDKIAALEVELEREKFSPMGAPRHLDEELTALKKVSRGKRKLNGWGNNRNGLCD